MADPINLDRVENWPPPGHNVGSVAHVHAFGQMALTSAMLEELICMLLVQRLPMFQNDAQSRIHGMNNRDRVEWLRAIVRAKEPDSAVADLFLHAIHCFDICMENRNMLVHALYEGTDLATASIKLTKRSRNNPLQQIKFQVPIEQLRKMAEEMGETVNFMLELWNCVRTRKAIEEQAYTVSWFFLLFTFVSCGKSHACGHPRGCPRTCGVGIFSPNLQHLYEPLHALPTASSFRGGAMLRDNAAQKCYSVRC
jgi:hypothetical protein